MSGSTPRRAGQPGPPDPGGVVAPTLPTRLREETQDAHEAIERDFHWEHQVATLDGYRGLLSRLYGFYAVWEPAAAMLVEDAFFAPRRKLHLLAADLHHLGLTSADLGRLPACRPGVRMARRPEAIGAMYVLEGSTLGGQIIARRIAETLGFGANGGCAYYCAYGAAIGTMWREFRDRLLDVPPDEHEAVLATATSTFACLHQWLSSRSAPGEER